jgi:hypothetical protein
MLAFNDQLEFYQGRTTPFQSLDIKGLHDFCLLLQERLENLALKIKNPNCAPSYLLST